LLVAEGRDDQQKAVRIVGARFPDLPRIEDEILAQDRDLDGFACVAEIFQSAAEKFTLCEDGEGDCSGGFERSSERDWVKGFANDSARGRGRL